MTLANNPEIVIRIGKIEFHKIGDPIYNVHIENRDILNRLRNLYGIAIPEFDLIIGAIDEDHVFYTVTERIHGHTLRDKVYDQQEIQSAKSKLEIFYSSLVQYFRDVFKNGGWYISDLVHAANWSGNAQYVFGRTCRDPEDKIYFVDLGPCLEWHDVDNEDLWLFDFHLPRLLEMIKETEEKLGSKLQKARQTFNTFLNSIPEVHQHCLSVVSLKRKLESE